MPSTTPPRRFPVSLTQIRPLAAALTLALLAASGPGCFITTDENLWKQRRDAAEASVDEAGSDLPPGDVQPPDGPPLDGPAPEGPPLDQAPAPDGPPLDQAPAPDGPPLDGPALEGPPLDQTPAPDRPRLDGPAPEGPVPDSTPVDTNKLPLGATCSNGTECASSHCADNVCCNTACTALCMACNLSGKKGTCSPIPAGQDPNNDCAPTPAASCGNDGSCDGSGACRKWPSGTSCGSNSCVGADTIQVKKCNGTGACISSQLSCSPYRCDAVGMQCYTSCSTDAECYKFRCETTSSTCYSKCTSNAECQPSYKCAGINCK